MKKDPSPKADTKPVSRLKRSTLADLAREMKVDASTISLALRDSRKVSEAMKEKIRALARLRGYAPNAHARALAGGRSSLLGVILPCSALPFYSIILDLLYEQAARQSLRLEAQFHQWEKDLELFSFRSMLEHQAEGIICFSGMKDPAATIQKELRMNAGTPICFWGRQSEESETLGDDIRGFVTVNVRLGAKMAAEHLLALGHRRIALSPVEQGNWLGQEMTEGITAAMESYPGARLVPISVPVSSFSNLRGSERTFAMGESLSQQFLALNPRPTAVITTDDTTAQVLMSILQAHSVRVPDDVSVVCSGNTYSSRYGAIPLSCVSMPLDLIAAKLVALVTSPCPTDQRREHIFQPEFISRASTARPREALSVSKQRRKSNKTAAAL